MLGELTAFHHELMATVDREFKRFLYQRINWNAKAICIYGARGVGKTTMLCQYLLDQYQTPDKALYISADNIHVIANGLLKIASEYFSLGGEALFIDEIHKYPNWEIELKNILDIYRNKKIIFSGSSAMELQGSKADLSRRVVYYELPGLSFREYLEINRLLQLDAFSLEEIIKNHVVIADQFKKITVLKHFKHYLEYGYYPFFLEEKDDYLVKLTNVVEKVLTEDIALSKNIKPSTIIILKRLLWLVATSTCLVPNIDKISKNLVVTREIVYSGFEYLFQSNLVNTIYSGAKGLGLVRKPGKIYMNNTNLLCAINGSLKLESDIGSIRETYFANQLAQYYKVTTHDKSDFFVDDKYIFEVGGKKKSMEQIQSLSNAFLAVDGIPIGIRNRIPLYLFGCLY